MVFWMPKEAMEGGSFRDCCQSVPCRLSSMVLARLCCYSIHRDARDECMVRIHPEYGRLSISEEKNIQGRAHGRVFDDI